MHIAFVEIQSFRKLKSVRVDFHPQRTLFVGANNSGKTSAMLCLGHFLFDPRRFTTNDFTLSNWSRINQIGAQWVNHDLAAGPLVPTISNFDDLLPTLDVWLSVPSNEIHYVSHVLPTLRWTGGLLGLRLRFEPDDLSKLSSEYILALNATKEIKQAGSDAQGTPATVPLWPQTLREFLDRRLSRTFLIRAYSLDETKIRAPVAGEAKPQPLPAGSEPIKGNALDGLIRIDEIGAQRGFGAGAGSLPTDERESGARARRVDQRKLSEQLRSYYARHLDPSEFPEPQDLTALKAIKEAQDQFDEKLKVGFTPALQEIQDLGYPGITDPRIIVSTRLTPLDGLNHDAAVQYEVASEVGKVMASTLRLPEEYNGLGYQNLISIVFRLMSFRDAWMQVGKASKRAAAEAEAMLPPLHLVLVEEPEAHLHAQVQQVFIRKAYEILRKHADLKDNAGLCTQLVVSTHSSHVAHECEFACLRYFRRRPAAAADLVPTSTVVNLSEVFGSEDQTPRFVARYLTATHSDLFFADAAIFVEGSAERMLVPHFIRSRFEKLYQRYITVLEIGGSHAHRLRPLIEALGLTTLVITDLDAVDAETRSSVQPVRGSGLETANVTLREWLPARTLIDDLLDLSDDLKVKSHADQFSIRVAYQHPVKVTMPASVGPAEALARTFEDALVLENLEFFRAAGGIGVIAKFRDAIANHADAQGLSTEFSVILRKMTKAAFALDLLFSKEPGELNVPTYIATGLAWLQEQLLRRDREILTETQPATGESKAVA